MWSTCILAFLFVQSIADVSKDVSKEELDQLMAHTKVEIAQSFFRSRIVRKDIIKLSLKQERYAEINFIGSGQSAGLFRRNKDNFIVNGSRVFKLSKNFSNRDDDNNKYFLDSTDEFLIEEGVILIQCTEWNNMFFLIVCYRRNYCLASISHLESSIAFQQRFIVQSTPMDIEFFVHDEELYLIVAGDPTKIYRWTGTNFDEYDELDTSGAKAVTTLRIAGVTVIVVAQHLQMKEAYSKVFILKKKKTELLHLLNTKGASDVASYSLAFGKDTNHFLFVLNNLDDSTIFWWSGREFSLWKRIEGLLGPGTIYVQMIHSQLFFFFTHQNKLNIYYPREMIFELVHFSEFDQHILDISLGEDEINGSPVVLLLKGNYSEPHLTLTLLSIDINYIPLEGNHKASNPTLQCLLQLKKKLQDRQSKLDEIKFLTNEIGKKSRVKELKKLTVPQLNLKNFKINKLKVNPSKVKLKSTPTEIRNDILKLKEEYDYIFPKLQLLLKQVHYRFHGNIFVNHMRANNICAKKFYDRKFNLTNILSVTKNQTLSGAIRLKTLSTNALTVPSINGINSKDILVRNKPLQEIMGEYTVQSMKARNIVFGKLGKLNNIPFSVEREFDDKSIKIISHKKTFLRLIVRQMLVDHINNNPAEQWLAKIFPSTRDFEPEGALNFTQLEVTDLTVSNINGMKWKDYLLALEKSAWKDRKVPDNESHLINITRKHLRVARINGIETEKFLTKDTHQTVDSTIITKSSMFPPVKVDIFIYRPNISSLSHQYRQNQELNVNLSALIASEIIFMNPATVSGKNVLFDNIKTTYWMKSWPQEIDSFITFMNEIEIKNLVTMQMNNKTVKNFVIGNESKKLECQLLFKNVKVFGSIAISSEAYKNVNLKKFYLSAVKRKGRNQLKGAKIFLGNVSLTKNFSLESLNGVPLNNSLPMKLSDNLQTDQAEFIGDIYVKNGVGIDYLNEYKFSNIMSNHTRSNGNVFNNIDLLPQHWEKNETRKTSRTGDNRTHFTTDKSKERLRLVIKGDLAVPKIYVTRVNNVAFNDYLSKVVLRNITKFSTIKGKKKFEKVVTIKENLDGALNGYNLTELEKNALSKSKPQNVTGTFFIDILNVNNADVKVIDEVFTENILFEEEFPLQIIHSDVLFNDFTLVGNLKSNNFMDGCDFSKMTKLKFSKMRKLGKLDVMGNVTWGRDRRDYQGISYLFGNSVMKHNKQTVAGSITFLENVQIDKLETSKPVNNVDFHYIYEDGIFRSIATQEIFQDITFRGKITTNNMFVEDNVIVDSVNGVDILDLGLRLIKNNAEVEVRGKKKFVNGFTILRLNAEAVNDAKTNQIIFCEDGPINGSIPFPATIFHSVKILKDLNLYRVNNVNLQNLLQERLSKNRIQKVKANIKVEGKVSIRGDSGISQINNLKLKDTLLRSGNTILKSIKGMIEFTNDLSLNEKIQVGQLNDGNITEFLRKAIMNMKDSFIKRNVIFKEDIEFRGNLDIHEGINKCETKNIRSMQLPIKIGYNETSYIKIIEAEISKIENNSRSLIKPIFFTDLHAKATLNLNISKFEKIITRYHGNNIEFDLYGIDDKERCQWNDICDCTVQKHLLISSSISNISSVQDVLNNYHKYFDENLNVAVTLTFSSSFNNSRCVDSLDTNRSYVTVSWKRLKANVSDERKEMEKKILTSNNSIGYLREVKFFTIDESIFIIMAFYFGSSEHRMNRLNIMVHELDCMKETIEKVQELEMRGIEKIDMFWTPKGVVLIAGNGYDSDTVGGSVDSVIYRFSDSENKFKLLRSFKTHGILDIASVRLEKESFIFIVQNQSWPFLILKYFPEYDNYYIIQKFYPSQLKSKATFLSAAAFTTARTGYEEETFIVIILSDGVFKIYKNKQMEGFVEILHQEQRNLEIMIPFRIDCRQYLLGASSGNHSIIYEVDQEGSN